MYSKAKYTTFVTLILLVYTAFAQNYIDKPFIQDNSHKYEMHDNVRSQLLQTWSDRNGVIKVLSTDGLLQPANRILTNDNLYRALSDMNIIAMQTYHDQFVYLTDNEVLSTAWAGKFVVDHDMKSVSHFVMGDDFSFLLAGHDGLAYFKNEKKNWHKSVDDFKVKQLLFDVNRQQFLILTESKIYSFSPINHELKVEYTGTALTALALHSNHEKIAVGTKDGFVSIDRKSFKPLTRINNNLPWPDITCLKEIKGRLWFGSERGAFAQTSNGTFDYYASKRWLTDDYVIDINPGPDGSVLILTKTGLNQICYKKITLAQKAGYFEKIQRQRHIRYGFNAKLVLKNPGDLSSGTYVDQDNDGLWTSMYLASEVLRYAVTKSDDALQNAYEAFEAMERLDFINPINGFPSRTFTRDGYEVADVKKRSSEDERIWRLTDDKKWRWKSTTSSDESCGHFFVYALFAEIIPDKTWKQRAIDQITRQMDHIIENDWYLVTWDGKPTQWGRWNPVYVNSFPIENGDRRLNSTLILAFLQTAYHFSGNEIYKVKAYELIDNHGYLENTLRPASIIGFVENLDLSDAWNHSDDEMYFLTVPALYKYAFSAEMKKGFYKTAESHWQIERSEKSALWNFIYGMIDGKEIDLDESVWWLKEFPMDLVSWSVSNSHRKDIELFEPNFRNQKTRQILPPDERPLHLHNTAAYRIDANEGGYREYPPYIYLLPYWMGRYIGVIGPEVE